jgi:hypothetical protein
MKTVLPLVILSLLAVTAAQADLMPNFANVPTGWSTDRYAPAGFSDIGTFQGRNDVLGISITSAGNAANRGGQNSTFYNTQGKGYVVAGGAGSTISADLYVPGTWSNTANGDVRSDMWGVLDGGADYAIIGFTNFPSVGGAFTGFRVWNGNLTTTACTGSGDCWIDLASPVQYDAWNALSIQFDGTDINYYVNGASVYSYATPGAAFTGLIMQAYNFADPALAGRNPQPYQADWSNAVPEPASVLSLATVVLALAGGLRRRLRKA